MRQIKFSKYAMIGYLKFEESKGVTPISKQIVNIKNEEYLSLGLYNIKSQIHIVYHKLYEFYGDPSNAKILLYDYNGNVLTDYKLFTNGWFEKTQKKL